MEQFKHERPNAPPPPRAEYIYSKEVEEIALKASEMKEFSDAVLGARNKFDALKAVRVLLKEHFPEIETILSPQVVKEDLTPPTPNEFVIAKHVVDLLYF